MKRKRGPGSRRSPTGLRARLEEAEATLQAIRTGQVDALVVSGPGGERTLAIEGATHPYTVLLNAMSDGAALLGLDGTILFGNRSLGQIVGVSLEDLRGSPFQQLVAPAERPGFEVFLRECAGRHGARESAVGDDDGSATPVWIALSPVALGANSGSNATVLMAIVTDLTYRKRAEATRIELLQRLMSAEDDERRRIARELHDETGQALTALLVGLRAIEEHSGTLDVPSAAQRLREVAAQTVDNVGRLARGLHPSVLDDMGLAVAARRHVSDFARVLGVTVDIRVENDVSRGLPSLVQTTMYRILQEALTNVARHARAGVVGVALMREETALELVVRDDGVGFDADAARREMAGLGLHGMQERVALLGGSVAIESRPGHGTTVRARIPVPPPPGRPAIGARGRSRDRGPD